MICAPALRLARLLLAAGVIASFAGFSNARAETFEFAVWFSDRDFYADHVRWWASEIEKRTEGRVKMKLHFSGSLVAAKETVASRAACTKRLFMIASSLISPRPAPWPSAQCYSVGEVLLS